MNSLKCFLFLLLTSISIHAQSDEKEILKNEMVETELDTVLNDTIQLDEILIYDGKYNTEFKNEFAILTKRVYVTYPYAKIAAERLKALNNGMSKLSTDKEKKKYFKIIENYLSNEFEARLKKLSRKQGQILVKLIHRQIGVTTYDLIKNQKSGWKAFWSNSTARVFDINLKAEYSPYTNNEDYLIETILVRAFESHRLKNQPPAKPINYDDLNAFWVSKSKEIIQ